MDKKLIGHEVPEVVVEHYQKLLSGYKRERNGAVIVEKYWSSGDEEAMIRLLTAPDMKDVWRDISEIFTDVNDQISLFDAAWRARINYDEYRFTKHNQDDRRKNKAIKLASDIKKRAEQLSSLLNQMSALGYRSVRHPDLNLNQSSLQDELSWLIEKSGSFNPDKVSDEEFVNAGIISQEANGKREYLRGFVFILHESGVALGTSKLANIVAAMGTAVVGYEDGGVSYDDAHRVIARFQEKLKVVANTQ